MTAIALASFKEVIRKKIILLIGLVTVIYLILFGLLVNMAYGASRNNGTNTYDMFVAASSFISVVGLYFSSMIAAFLTIMASISAVSSEIESGVIHSIITRPIGRKDYVLGKYVGLAVLITAYSLFLYVSIFAISLIIGIPSVQAIGLLKMFYGLLLFILQPLVILSLCIYGSVSFKTLNNGIFVVSIYILGLIGSMMEQVGAFLKSDSLYRWGIISSLISPFDVIYRQMMATLYNDIGLTNPLMPTGFLPTTLPSRWMMVYIVLYALMFIYLAVKKFNRKDIG